MSTQSPRSTVFVQGIRRCFTATFKFFSLLAQVDPLSNISFILISLSLHPPVKMKSASSLTWHYPWSDPPTVTSCPAIMKIRRQGTGNVSLSIPYFKFYTLYLDVKALHADLSTKTATSTAINDYNTLDDEYIKYLKEVPSHPAWVRL